ncbi:helix-turn-helix protein [Paraburkholderia silvatlantica]|uniref:Helix-turn-helix protein n=1 Tax=Paraburkholderia silvatlantica TaxID=321895 RepID=A0A2V4U3N2_9BURK|nr:helix-turn-helix domain-containing protein [Paraburkholderia silvatlantica]PYE22850.1 helix-turn-helix protein [Paraburkholderia silvatlantica]
MLGKIDTSFATTQRDFFTSGLAAEIGMNAFGIWLAIKQHADYNSGKSWPGVRQLASWTGLNKDTVTKQLKILEEHRLLKWSPRGRRGRTYIARERLDIRIGDLIVCTIVVDYVPSSLRGRLDKIKNALETGRDDGNVWAEVEIIPGSGFTWDAASKTLKRQIDSRVLRTESSHIACESGAKAEFDQKTRDLLAKWRAPREPA